MADATKATRIEDETEDEDEEGLEDAAYKTVRDAVLFAIDINHSMLQPLPQKTTKHREPDTAAAAALKCASQLMQQRIISHPKDVMGIMLFGTKESSTLSDGDKDTQLEHCYLLCDLEVPAAQDVKRVRSIVEGTAEDCKKLFTPSPEPTSIANVLFCANQIFEMRAANFLSRRLFLVTDNDDPHTASKELRASAVVRARDLYDLGITIELFPISRPDHEFDRGKFYDDIIYKNTPADPGAPSPLEPATKAAPGSDGVSLLNSLLSSIMSRSAPRTRLFRSLPLEFGPDLKISVSGYTYFKRQAIARSCYVWVDGEIVQIAEQVSSKLSDESAQPIEKNEIRKAFRFGGGTVSFTPEELSELRNFGDPVIRILGFKDRALLPLWANFRPATFIYPNEEDYVGSTRVFSALQQTLLSKRKFALTFFIARKNATPVTAALIPGAETRDARGSQTMPPGLWIVPLPFADDIRQPPETSPSLRAPDSLVDKMRAIIGQLHLLGSVYEPAKYPNPALQWHYRILQAKALDEDMPEVPEDKTVPKYKAIDKRAGSYALEFRDELDRVYKEWQLEYAGQHPGAKRPFVGQTSPAGAQQKKAKTESQSQANSTKSNYSDEQMRELFRKNKVNVLTVSALKDWLGSKGLSLSGKKNELVDRINQHFENKMDVD